MATIPDKLIRDIREFLEKQANTEKGENWTIYDQFIYAIDLTVKYDSVKEGKN